MAMDSPWSWIVHGHGQFMAMENPWQWTVHGHGQSMAGKRAVRARSERSEPGHKVPFTIQAYGTVYYTGLRHRLLYKLTAPFTIQAYGTVYYTSLRHGLLYKLTAPFTIQAYRTSSVRAGSGSDRFWFGRFSPTRLAFGVLTFQIENRMV